MSYVLLADIKGSRKLPPTTVYTVLNDLCKRINQNFDLAVPMVITLGMSGRWCAKAGFNV